MTDRTTISDDNVIYEFTPDLTPSTTVGSGDSLTVRTIDSTDGTV